MQEYGCLINDTWPTELVACASQLADNYFQVWFLKLTLVRKHFKPVSLFLFLAVSLSVGNSTTWCHCHHPCASPPLPPPKRCWKYAVSFILQGEIDAHEDSFKSADESGQALLAAGHYASDEVREKVK